MVKTFFFHQPKKEYNVREYKGYSNPYFMCLRSVALTNTIKGFIYHSIKEKYTPSSFILIQYQELTIVTPFLSNHNDQMTINHIIFHAFLTTLLLNIPKC